MQAGPAGFAPLCAMIIDVDRIEAAKHLHDPVVLARGAADHQKRMPAAETLGIEVRIFIRHGVPFHGRPVIEIAAVFQQLDRLRSFVPC